MFLEAQSKQFTLKDDGQIFFQPDSTNPLPGEPLATVRKGQNLLQPTVALIEGRDLNGEDSAAVCAHVETWMKAHIYTVLEPLFALVTDETLAGPVKDIALKIFEHTGIVSRAEVDAEIAQLDAEMRKVLRAKKVRLGPVLVFLPDLNKPVAVRLRALLWSLYNDAPLPAPSPRDGAMSAVVDVATANPNFYRAIGYPLYGPRVIRIDMLDRVINAVYDGSKEGKFQAEHKMAEWMGCPIADLYAILEAMGHKRQEKPAVVVPVSAEPAIEAVAEIVTPVEVVVAENVVANEVSTEVVAEPVKPVEQKKPELDWFLLRRGKAHTEQAARKPRTFVREENFAAAKPAFPKERFEPKKSYGKKDDNTEGDARPSFKKKKRDDTSDDKRSSGKHSDDKRGDRKPSNDARVYTAAASATDNPFAILQGLKLK